ncbi:hypothetical protein [Pseudomonas abietaniphila]|uniref:Sel1 repeat-containing protein n=1 Tax=Pseudomonas abietaniphila TaxID=89065 RepID=A0A1G8R005_9PSED|nr:hypothetical protein [Pseudomonas abietaniphila]SDJ09885.1 hypothetical protein SAMN05216605_121108 [Pseudomonas abietaniphila]
MHLKFAAAFLIAGLAAAISGCDQAPSPVKQLQEARKVAESGTDKPWERLVALEVAAKAAQDQCGKEQGFFSFTYCDELTPPAKLEAKLLKLALEQGSKAAYGFAFLQAPYWAQDFQMDFTSRLLSIAGESAGQKDDRLVLRAAGRVLRDGTYVLKDTQRAASYLGLAWALGEEGAARDLAAMYGDINDFQNAYLWSLRCMAACANAYPSDKIEKRLDPATILGIQKLAGDKTVLTVSASNIKGQS